MAGAAAAAAAGALTLEGCAREPALAGELGGADWRRGHRCAIGVSPNRKDRKSMWAC
jgi:hypothetical protein